MNPALWAALGGVTAVLLVALVGAVAMLAVRRGESTRAAALDAAREDVESLRAQVEELSGELRRARSATPAVLPSTEFVITTAGEHPTSPARSSRPQVPEGAVLSVTLGEPLVKIAAWSYGVRRALAPESRNRIAFEMRREVKRSRKERRRSARRARVTPTCQEDNAA